MSDTTTEPVPPASDKPSSGIRSFWAKIDQPFTVGFTLTLGGLAAVLLGIAISNLATVIIYIVLALFAALGIEPVVNRLMRRGVKRGWAIAVVFFGLAVLLVGILWLVIPTVVEQISQFVQDIPSLFNAAKTSDWYTYLQGMFGAAVPDLLNNLEKFITDPGNIAAIGGGAVQVGINIVSGISGAFITLVLTLYFIASMPGIKAAFYRLAPARNRPGLRDLTEQITGSIGGYLIGMVVLATANAIFAFILHLILGLPFPALMAVIAFLITLIPLIGPVLYWIIASVIALFTDPVTALLFAVFYLAYIQIEAYVLTPRVMNRTISIPGSLVVIGALVGGTLLGLIGALVAIPVSASVLLIIKQVWVPRQDAKV